MALRSQLVSSLVSLALGAVTGSLGMMTATRSFAEEAQAATVRIADIQIEGLKRTKKKVVLRELMIAPGDTVSVTAIEEAIQRARNTQIFGSVSYVLEDAEAGGKILRVRLEERWTTIPIAKFASGGGVSRIVLGVYDVNLLGSYLEAGGQYERLGDENAGVVWFRNPRLFDQRLELFVSLWDIQRAETIYRDLGQSMDIEADFLTHRQQVSMSLKKEWLPWLATGVLVDYNTDKCSNELAGAGPEVKASQVVLDHAELSRAIVFGVSLQLGRLDYRDGFLVDGVKLEHTFRQSSRLLGSTARLTGHETELVAFATLPYYSTLGLRLGSGFNETDSSHYYFFLGGLNRIRGFQATRFYGKKYWLANVEYRVPVYQSPLVVVQPTVFYDAVGFGLKTSEINDNRASSAGVGIRLIAPKIYRLVLRLDYAHPLENDDMAPISFGIQQFF